MSSEREQLEQQIDKFRIFVEKHIGTDQKFSKLYHYYFDLKYNKKGILTSAKENMQWLNIPGSESSLSAVQSNLSAQ